MKINAAGYGSCEGFRTHHHDNQWELHLFVSGEGVFHNDNNCLPLSTGMLTYSKPLQTHGCKSKNCLTDYYYIGFQYQDNDDYLKSSIDDIFARHSHLYLERAVFSELGRIIRKSRTENPSIIKSSEHLFSSLLFEIVANNGRSYIGDGSDLASTLLDLLQKNTYNKISLDDIAEQTGFDKSYLIRVFKNKYNITPIQYLLKLKIDAACFLLEHSELNIKEIAYQLKFYDEYYFSRKFKEITKQCPRQYRTRWKEKFAISNA